MGDPLLSRLRDKQVGRARLGVTAAMVALSSGRVRCAGCLLSAGSGCVSRLNAGAFGHAAACGETPWGHPQRRRQVVLREQVDNSQIELSTPIEQYPSRARGCDVDTCTVALEAVGVMLPTACPRDLLRRQWSELPRLAKL
ncbi:hypothetical protein GCM10009608_70850 [Pseudonocardia alaniniphila]